MKLSKDALRILKLANKRESIDFEDVFTAVSKSAHTAYAAENLTPLKDNGLLHIHNEMMPEGYEKMTIRITPEGQAELESYMDITREKWITRGTAILALVISLISLLKK